MSYLNSLPEDVERMIWKTVFDESLPHIPKKAHEYYKKQYNVLYDKEKKERNQYKSYVNSRGNIVIEPVPYVPNSQTGKYGEYLHFSVFLQYEILGFEGDLEEICKTVKHECYKAMGI